MPVGDPRRGQREGAGEGPVALHDLELGGQLVVHRVPGRGQLGVPGGAGRPHGDRPQAPAGLLGREAELPEPFGRQEHLDDLRAPVDPAAQPVVGPPGLPVEGPEVVQLHARDQLRAQRADLHQLDGLLGDVADARERHVHHLEAEHVAQDVVRRRAGRDQQVHQRPEPVLLGPVRSRRPHAGRR